MKPTFNIPELKTNFSGNKVIPQKYEREILIALSHYPELKNVHIEFTLANHALVAYGATPTFFSCFVPKRKRTYTITILENADYPLKEALFKNLTEEMRIGVMAHELVHVIQYNKCNPLQLLKLLASYLTPNFRRNMEREADEGAITHGFGKELLKHTNYIRSIPGYLKKRPGLGKNYLDQDEILYYLKHPDAISRKSAL